MSYEIKEILDKMIETRHPSGVFLTAKTRDKIIDYITNLQEENGNYISRVEKAVEYIKEQEDYFVNYPLINKKSLLNILQGEDNDN